MKTHKSPKFITSFLLSLFPSLVLPYVFLGLSFKLTSCKGGLFCLPLGVDLLFLLGLIFFAFPFLIVVILLQSLANITNLSGTLDVTSFTISPGWPISRFSMIADLTFLLALLPQIFFWALVIHSVRIRYWHKNLES